MIRPVTMYECICDNCGKTWEDEHYGWCAMTDGSSCDQMATDSGWHKLEEYNTHICTECFGGFDDDDNVIIKNVEK